MLAHCLWRWPINKSALGNGSCLSGMLHINSMLSGLMYNRTGQGRWPESVTRTGSGHHGSWSDTNSSHKLPPDRGLVRTRVWYCLPVPTDPEKGLIELGWIYHKTRLLTRQGMTFDLVNQKQNEWTTGDKARKLLVVYHPLYGMNNYVLISGDCLSCDPLKGSHDSQSPHIWGWLAIMWPSQKVAW